MRRVVVVSTSVVTVPLGHTPRMRYDVVDVTSDHATMPVVLS
jgi:hypothetical protein